MLLLRSSPARSLRSTRSVDRCLLFRLSAVPNTCFFVTTVVLVTLQEIVAKLVTHKGCGIEAEVDLSLEILLELVENRAALVAPFTIFIKVCRRSIDRYNSGVPIF